MKSVISGLLVAFSMYSAIPVPQVNWEKQTMRWALGFLPLIGVLIGAIEWFWFAFCVHFGAAGVFLRCDRSADSSGSVRRHSSGRPVRYLRRAVLVRRPGKAAGHPQGPARWRVRAALADGIPAGRGRVFLPRFTTGLCFFRWHAQDLLSHGQWAAARWLRHRARKTADLHIYLRKTAINARYRAC